MHRPETVQLKFDASKPAVHRGWVKYFVAALGLGMGAVQAQQQQVLLDYWWVMPREEVQNAPRVIRVIGAKGERFEEVYAEEQLAALQNNPAIMQARVERQASLRREAQQRARELREAGKSPAVAYEEAWAEVYSRRWLNADWSTGSSKLEDMLNRLAAENEDLALTEEEQQWVLEALLEDDDRLESEQGRALLSNLARRLRSLGYGRLYSPTVMQDELMERFAEALRHGKESMAAYRDALFKTNRDRIMHHELRGYLAPWGMGAGGGGGHYRQAPIQLTTTVNTGNSPQQGADIGAITVGPQHSAPVLNAAPGVLNDFLATAPAASEADDEEEKDEDELLTGEGEQGVSPASAPAPMMMTARSMSLRSTGAVALAADDGVATAADSDIPVTATANLTVSSKAALYFGTDGLTASGKTRVYGSGGNNNRSYTVLNYGSYEGDITWQSISGRKTAQFWRGDKELSPPGRNKTVEDSSTNSVEDKLSIIDLREGAQLYMGGAAYQGIIRVVEYSDSDPAYLGSYLQAGAVYNMGKLTGSGTLTLVAHGSANQASIYSFNDAESDMAWFKGTVQFGVSQGGIVELDLGSEAVATTEWKNTVFDLTPMAAPGHDTTADPEPERSRTILNIRGDVTIAGLKNGDARSTVTSESGDKSYTLTLGNDTTDYSYSGTFNGSYYTTATSWQNSVAPFNLTKVGSNTQSFTTDMTGNAALNIITVDEGKLEFGNVESAHVVVNDGGTLTADNLTVDSTQASGALEVALQINKGATVEVSGTTTAYNANVYGALDTGTLAVTRMLHVDEEGHVKADSITAESVTAAGNSKIDASRMEVREALTIHRADVLTTEYLSAHLLEVHDGGVVRTSSQADLGNVELYGGSTWEMQGTGNSISGTMYLESTASTPAVLKGTAAGTVLTMPGMVDFARAGWTGSNAVLALDNILLDFSHETVFSNLDFDIDIENISEENPLTVTLATLANGAGYDHYDTTQNVFVWYQGQALHATLGYKDTLGNDGVNELVLNIMHPTSQHPFALAHDGVVYIEMYEDAHTPAMPYMAYTPAQYQDGKWTGEELSAIKLFSFSNVNFTEGGNLYMGESAGAAQNSHHFGGNINIVRTADNSSDSAMLHGQMGAWGSWLLDGHLGGTGNLTLVAHHGTSPSTSKETVSDTVTTTTVHGTASTFTFTNAGTSTPWLEGTVRLANPSGGIVQLNVGNVNVGGAGDTRWKNTVIDLTADSVTDEATGTTGTPAANVLGIMGNTRIQGLVGDSESSVVAHTTPGKAYTLTLGSDAEDYSFGGSIGSGRFYTGGVASEVVTEITSTITNSEGVSEPVTTTSTTRNNFADTEAGSLNLVKVGSKTQTFTGTSSFNEVAVLGGTLAFSGDNSTSISHLTVGTGATFQDGGKMAVASVTLYGGSTLDMCTNVDMYDKGVIDYTPIYLKDLDTAGSVTISNSSDSDVTWKPSLYINMSDTELPASGALFALDSDVNLTLGSSLLLTNVAGLKGGESIALYSGLTRSSFDFSGKTVLVEGADGHFYDASYSYENGTVYVNLGKTQRDYGIVVERPDAMDDEDTTTLKSYIWSGVDNGTTQDDVNHIGLTMGHEWRADGSAGNTGWHEQRAAGSSNDDIGIYVNGFHVTFGDKNVHDAYVEEAARNVLLKGKVAPGCIYVTADINEGHNGKDEAQMRYGYAFTSLSGAEGYIADVDDKTPTRIVKDGKALLVLNTVNSFTGGIDVQDGGLYLGMEGAAGTGTLTFHTDRKWQLDEKTVSGWRTVTHDGAELVVSYLHSNDNLSAYRNGSVSNDIVLVKTGATGDDAYNGSRFTISFGTASYNVATEGGTNDHVNVPRHWRNFNFTGALVGTGSKEDELVLTSYSSTWTNYRDQSFVTSFTFNENTKDLVYDADHQRFHGTVVFKNTVNTSELNSNSLASRTAGTGQLRLAGDKLQYAVVDLTRESEQHPGEDAPRQTYSNVFVLDGEAVTLRGLQADFLGSGHYYNPNNGWDTDKAERRVYQKSMAQNDEVWHVRTVTSSTTTLHLGDAQDATEMGVSYVYSGAMGFAQSYVDVGQGHVAYGDGFDKASDVPHNYNTPPSWLNTDSNQYTHINNSGPHSMGTEGRLSLVKEGASNQYIHSAIINNLSVYGGTLGFNNLELRGNVNLVGGSTLALGVVEEGETSATDNLFEVKGIGWKAIAENTSSSLYSIDQNQYEVAPTSGDVIVSTGKTLTVYTPKSDDGDPQAAVVEGDVTMESEAALTFVVNGVVPSTTHEYVLLDVNGEFNLLNETGITINFSGVDFSRVEKFNEQLYYIAEANDIVIGNGGDSSVFQSRIISMGYGYFGVLDTLDSSRQDGDESKSPNKNDYLVIRVHGDPRRTWSGKTSVKRNQSGITKNGSSYSASETPFQVDNVWRDVNAEPEGKDAFDYRWKENQYFENGMVVLFGNLYEPDDWTEVTELTSTQTPIVDLDKLEYGHPADSVKIDEHTIVFKDANGKDAPAAYKYESVVIEGRVAPLSVVINSDYFDRDGNAYTDSTNYIFSGTGYIDDAETGELDIWKVENPNWMTSLTKMGTGTTIMTTDNRYTGGTEILGGRIVMQHVNALGFVYNTGAYATPDDETDDENNLDDQFKDQLLTGLDCTITLMNGGELMGDFDDAVFPGNHEEGGNVSQGAAMKTTTIRNKVVVNVYANPNEDYENLVDGRVLNSVDKKLILRELAGESDTVIEFSGVGLTADQSSNEYGVDNKFRYGVFKVLDPGGFYGTVQMSGQVWKETAPGLWDLTSGGRVQLDIMSTAKSDDDADWLNATIDLTVKKGTERTVLALDVMSGGEICEVDRITGKVEHGSSSVLNLSKGNAATLEIKGTRDGDYDGVFGYGDFQVAVDYGGYGEELQGTTQHHYGAKGHGSLNVIKEGAATAQTVRRAWLNDLVVNAGDFRVKEALVANSIVAGNHRRVMVGNVALTTVHALNVGDGGILAMNTTFPESGEKTDAWEGVEAGFFDTDNNPAGWVLLTNGATLSAREDWFTRKQIDIATGAGVTINTHNYAIDPFITSSNDVFGKFHHAHIIQLLGTMTGHNVALTFNNAQISPGATELEKTSVSPYIGYVAINDLNVFTGSNTATVDSMTVLQLMQGNKGVEGDMHVSVVGQYAAMQVVDGLVQYVDELVLGANNLHQPGAQSDDLLEEHKALDPRNRANNGQLMLGGVEMDALAPNDVDYLTRPADGGLQVLVTGRHDHAVVETDEGAQVASEMQGKVTNLHMDVSGTHVVMGGKAGHQSDAENVHVDVIDSAATHVIQYTDLHNSLVHLQEDCSVNIAETVLVDYQSAVMGVNVTGVDTGCVDPQDGPSAAAGFNPSIWTREVTTSESTTVQLTFADNKQVYTVGNSTILVLQMHEFLGVDVTGNGLTLQMYDDMLEMGYHYGAEYIAVMIGGGSGRFLYEQDDMQFNNKLDSQYVLQDKQGNNMEGYWVSSITVSAETGANVSMHMLYFRVPEPATTTLSLLALAALCARRRR